MTAYVLSTAPAWNRQKVLRWLTGSLNGAQLSDSANLLFALALCGAILFSQHRDIEALRHGDDTAAALGVKIAARGLRS